MQPEILFRGKRLNNGEWVEGFYTEYSPSCIGCVIETLHDDYKVDSTTIGRYTGLTDKNGVRIFEGDILCDDEPGDPSGEYLPVLGVVRFGEYSYNDSQNVGFFVEWKDNEDDDYSRTFRKDLPYWAKYRHCEVIGNIHDNLELLGGNDEKAD